MSQPTMESLGNTGDSSCGNSAGPPKRTSFFLTTVLYVLTRPACVLFMGISWYHLSSLCRFGRLYKNVPILFVCLLWWIGVVVYGLRLWRSYKRNRQEILFKELEEFEKCSVLDRDVKWFIRKKDTFHLFLKDRRALTLNLSQADDAAKDFFLLKLSAVSFWGKKWWRGIACVLIAAMTVSGARAVIRSAMPFQGKLGNYLASMENEITVKLVHDNIYEYGLQGVLEDIGAEVQLPDTLCLVTSFNLHFAPDGKILTMDTMVCGFDAEGNFVDSYLISYNAQRSSKISIHLHGAVSNTLYREEKDLTSLVEAVSLIPLEQTVQQWDGEDCYGILYYGMREWFGKEGIRILKEDGTVCLPPEDDYYFYGYSISLFCPENEQLTPLRYLYPDYLNEPTVDRSKPYPADYYP